MLDSSQSLDSQQQSYQSAYNDTRIPAYPGNSTPRSAPPPLPSSSTKPVFQRPKRTKSSSISILSSGLGLLSRDGHTDGISSTDTRRRHRKSASLSGSDVDFSIDSQRAVTPQPIHRPASPSPSLSESIYSLNRRTSERPAPSSHSSASSLSKQHKQAWYQAQQKTIELDNPNNRGAKDADSDTAKLFPLNVAVPDEGERGRSSPTDARSPRPVVETFLSEEEMLAAGIHIIRRRDDTATSVSTSSKDSQGLETPRLRDQAVMPAMPPRLYGADQTDFLELIDSPADSKQTSPMLDRITGPPASSASMQRALLHSHNKSSSGSISASSSGSTDYVPFSAQNHDDAYSAHNGSVTSLGSGSKHSFSFAKLRRAGVKQSTAAASSSRPSTANSSNEDVSGNRTFLFPSRHQQRQQQQLQSASNGDAAAPGYLTPGPGSSASPFLNKHSATVGRATGSIGAKHTAKTGLAQVFNGGGSSAATVGPASSAYKASSTNGLPPPKPPKPKPSLLTAFPRSGGSNRSLAGSISAPNTAPLGDESTGRLGVSQQDMLQPPVSRGNVLYGSMAHSRSQEAVAGARLEAEALRASAGTPLPPPRRLPPRAGGSTAYSSTAMGRASSSGTGGVVGALGQVGQLGAAMGRKGWDFMKTLQNSNSAGGAGVGAPGRGDGGAYSPGFLAAGYASATPSASVAAHNDPTRQWLLLLETPDTAKPATGIFDAPLKDAVLRSRLSSLSSSVEDHLSVPDLGKDFSASFLASPSTTPRASLAVGSAPLSREEARSLFLPRLVVRCIESLERWGPSEEGIYRISGRSSHTNKLRSHFADPRNDLKLDEVNPADLDINSVCSLLKSYLRELPEPLLPVALGKTLDGAVGRLLSCTTEPTTAGGGGKVTDARVGQIEPSKVAEEIAPLMGKLDVYNWYLLRELSCHLGMLAAEEVVKSTKMPLSNLTLVLAPTVGISLPVLQVMVRHRELVFAVGPVNGGDMAASVAGVKLIPEKREEREEGMKAKSPPPRPVKPEKLTPSKLPVMVRKRASSIGLGALLSSPTRSKTTTVAPVSHRRTPSTTPSLDLPVYITAPSSDSVPSSPIREPYARPSTSLGHFPDTTPIARQFARFTDDHLTTSPSLSDEEARSGRMSALDRPRPPTSSQASFFAGRSRRTDSVSLKLAGDGVEGGGTRPLRSIKKATGGGAGEGVEREEEEGRDVNGGREGDVRRRVERYLADGPARA